MITVIISGGQTGADMGGLVAARELRIETGGYAAKGWLTEKGPNPQLADWGLLEWHEAGYPARTKANVLLADATLIFGKRSAGSNLTWDLCHSRTHPRPALWVGDVCQFNTSALLACQSWVQGWLEECQPDILNIAGNRESKNPGIQLGTWQFLVSILS